jgi:geranylgeranyl pyrophosphate synthase
MIAGQVVDLDSEGKRISEQNLEVYDRNKTGCSYKSVSGIWSNAVSELGM